MLDYSVFETRYFAKFYLASGRIFESDEFRNKKHFLKYVNNKVEFFESMRTNENDREFHVLKVELFSYKIALNKSNGGKH